MRPSILALLLATILLTNPLNPDKSEATVAGDDTATGDAAQYLADRWGWEVVGDELSEFCCELVGGSLRVRAADKQTLCVLPAGTDRQTGKKKQREFDQCEKDIN